jgi:hypothetical protein
MPINRKGLRDPSVRHRDEGSAIRQSPVFVGAAAVQRHRSFEEFMRSGTISTESLDCIVRITSIASFRARTAANAFPDLDHNELGCDQRQAVGGNFLGPLQGDSMPLIAFIGECEDVSGVQKSRGTAGHALTPRSVLIMMLSQVPNAQIRSHLRQLG